MHMNLHTPRDKNYSPAAGPEQSLFDAAYLYSNARGRHWLNIPRRFATRHVLWFTIERIGAENSMGSSSLTTEALLKAFEQGYKDGLRPTALDYGYHQYRADIQGDNNYPEIERIEAAIRKLAAKTPAAG
jgi:hypothetical protein